LVVLEREESWCSASHSDELLVAGKIGVSRDADGQDIAATIDDAEARVRRVLPSARIIYLEPDIYRPEPTAR
jgi:hypothetical protein